MRNRLHNVLGGLVQCRRVRHTCTICSFPGYCLGLRTRQKMFFSLSYTILSHLLTLLSPKCWDFPIFMLTDNRRQTTDKLIALPLAAHARTRGNNNYSLHVSLHEGMDKLMRLGCARLLWTRGTGVHTTRLRIGHNCRAMCTKKSVLDASGHS